MSHLIRCVLPIEELIDGGKSLQNNATDRNCLAIKLNLCLVVVGHDGHLTKCPTSPNCVVSQGGDETHAIAPIPYQSDLATAKETLLKVLAVVPGTTIVEETDNYIRTESESRIMGFIDDAEFYFPVGENVIEIRSASRLGESDLGVNRRRLEQIRFALADLNV